MATPLITIVTLLVFLSSLQTTESRNTPLQNENSIRQEQRGNQPEEEECALRRPDGTCHNQWRVGKKGKNGLDMLERRQANCNRKISPNCRVMVGKKRAPSNIDCTQLEGRRSLLCRKKYYKRLNPNTPCDKRSGKCENLYMYKTALKSADLETKETQRCDLKSPLCYVPFPGKRKPKHKELIKRSSPDETGSRFSLIPETGEAEVEEEVDHKDSVTVTENDLLGELLVARGTTKLPYELSETDGEHKVGAVPTVAEDDNSKPTCDPKRDFQCRFRIFAGKRDQIFNRPTYPKSYNYN